MRELPLLVDGCTLSAGGLAAQVGRCPFFAINVGDRSRRPALEALAGALMPRGG